MHCAGSVQAPHEPAPVGCACAVMRSHSCSHWPCARSPALHLFLQDILHLLMSAPVFVHTTINTRRLADREVRLPVLGNALLETLINHPARTRPGMGRKMVIDAQRAELYT